MSTPKLHLLGIAILIKWSYCRGGLIIVVDFVRGTFQYEVFPISVLVSAVFNCPCSGLMQSYNCTVSKPKWNMETHNIRMMVKWLDIHKNIQGVNFYCHLWF